jgi:hypothetical protein
MGSGPFSEDDLDTLPRLFKFHKQLTLLSQLEGTLHDFSLLLYHHFPIFHFILSLTDSLRQTMGRNRKIATAEDGSLRGCFTKRLYLEYHPLHNCERS